MKVLFVNLYLGTLSRTPFHSGIAALAAICQREGFEAETLTITRREEFPQALERIRNCSAGVLAFSISSPEWPNVKTFLDLLKKTGENRPVVVGGYHPTIRPDEVIHHALVKYLFIGEVDEVFPEFLYVLERGQEPKNIPNLWWKRRQFFKVKVHRNPVTYLPTDLDLLPLMDRQIFLREWGCGPEVLSGMGGLPVLAGRGCPFECGFCCNGVFKKMFSPIAKYVRKRSPESVVAEMKELQRLYDPPAFELWDELFAVNREWTEQFCELYKREIARPYSVLLRADVVTEELLEKLYDSGCRMAMFGVETGNEEFRRRILKKPISNRQIEEVFRLCREIGIETFAFVIVGLPGETPELLQETVDFCYRLRPTFLGPQLFYPLPGTELGENSQILSGYYRPYEDIEYFIPKIKNTMASSEEIVKAFNELMKMSEEFAREARNWTFEYRKLSE